MTLATHAIVGAALATAVPAHPVVAFGVGFASHFLLDAIPHWDYHLASAHKDTTNEMNDDMIIGKSFLVDLLKIGADIAIGVAVSLFLFGSSDPSVLLTVICGAAGAIAPDGLQFIYFKWRHEPLTSLQQFHTWIHADTRINGKPAIGIALQMVVVALCVLGLRIVSLI